jgi:NADH-quinone oxidoreductase subunit L
MGGLRKQMPVTFWLYLIGTLALAGIFPLAGFWSKDEILAAAQLHYPVVYILLTIAAFFTAFYMGRQVWLVFFGKARHASAAHAEESKPIITAPLIVLAGLSILGGALNLPYLHTFTHWLGYTLGGEGAAAVEGAAHTVEAAPWYVLGGLNLAVAGLSTLLALVAIYFSWLIYGRKPLAAGQKDPLKKALSFIFTGMERKWFVDEIYWAAFVNRYVDLARFLADVIDARFWHDWFHDKVLAGTYNWLSRIALDKIIDTRGIDAFFNGLGELTKRASASLRRLQNGFVRSYALAVLFGVVVILGYLLMK